MAGNGAEKASGPSKSFMTVGPTLHYSHSNVMRCWWLAVAIYVVACLFWSRILTGTALELNTTRLIAWDSWALGPFILSPISIYEYPWQIVVLGWLMALLAVTPILTAQLLSFRFSLPMILAAVLIARLHWFGAFLAISCIAVACRPLRFRSRFIAVLLCTSPQLIYWAAFGGVGDVDPIRWGFSYAPWLSAWLMSLTIAAAVLAIGHYTRYKPGLIFSVSGVVLIGAVTVFFLKISFSELDYQLYIAKNNPEEVREFYDRSMSEAIDRAIVDTSTESYLRGLFYPTEPILLRKELKNEIINHLSNDLWPNWFVNILPEECRYQAKRQHLLNQYQVFIEKWPASKRMPIALYYMAMLNEYRPDVSLLARSQREILHFYNTYPHRETLVIWNKLHNDFPDSPESLEARWRIAVHAAGMGQFAEATRLCEQARASVEELLISFSQSPAPGDSFLTAFSAPARTVMTPFKLRELKIKLDECLVLISEQNRTDDPAVLDRLARFVVLNPYSSGYAEELDELLKQMGQGQTDPLMDNVTLAKVMLMPDAQLKAAELKAISERFANTDGGIRALYELGLLKVGLWKDAETRPEDRKKYLGEARAILSIFMNLYPQSIFSEQARTMLNSLPDTQ
ncbi:MAG: hypothetical protein IH624_02155 [Phycisphaerae bacterium]|nr:hypothetical protein [Phycisphaerae bacterium]